MTWLGCTATPAGTTSPADRGRTAVALPYPTSPASDRVLFELHYLVAAARIIAVPGRGNPESPPARSFADEAPTKSPGTTTPDPA
jgi:hypothetical protein